MRWLGFAALLLVASGCTVHVVERPVAPVMVAEPAHPYRPRTVAAAPRHDAPARPARTPRPQPQPERSTVEPPRESLKSAAEVRPASLEKLKPAKQARPSKPVKSKPARPARPPKRQRLDRYDIKPSDVPPITDKPEDDRAVRAPRSSRFTKPQQHARDLRH